MFTIKSLFMASLEKSEGQTTLSPGFQETAQGIPLRSRHMLSRCRPSPHSPHPVLRPPSLISLPRHMAFGLGTTALSQQLL